MKVLIALFAALVCGCAGRFDAVPAHSFPDHLTSEQADSLYESNALQCDDGECRREDGTRPLRAYSDNGYEDSRDVLASHRRARLVGGLVPGVTGAAAVLLGVAFMSIASNTEQTALSSAEFGVDPTDNLEKAASYRTFSTAMFIVGPALAATGLIIGLALPDGYDEFEAEYNRSLRRDLDRRVRSRAGHSGVVVLPPRHARR